MGKQVDGDRGNKQIALQENFSSISKFLRGDGMLSKIKGALPRHMSPDRMCRVALICIGKNAKLMQCTPESLGKALVECSSYGLEPNGRDIHLVPFWNSKKNVYEVQVIPDYKGLVQLMYRSGIVMNVMAQAVRAKDEFKYRFGTGAFVEHKPADEDDRGPLRYAWCMVSLKGGGEPFVVLNRAQVMEHKKASRGSEDKDSPWQTYPDAMWAKTALRVLSKFVPLSAEIIDAFDRDDEANTVEGTVESATFVDATLDDDRVEKESKSDRLAGRLEQQEQEEDDGNTIEGEVNEPEPPKKSAPKQEKKAETKRQEPEREEQEHRETTAPEMTGEPASAVLTEYREMLAKADKTSRVEKLMDHFMGKESQFELSQAERDLMYAEGNERCRAIVEEAKRRKAAT